MMPVPPTMRGMMPPTKSATYSATFEQGINAPAELRDQCCTSRWSDPQYPGCYPWGPYVPPSDEAVPSSRSPQIREAVEAALRNVA